MSGYAYTVGVDWGSREHAVCLLESSTKKRKQRQFPHCVEGTKELLCWLREEVDDLARVAVAWERPDHPLVDAFLDAGVACFALNPLQSERFRDRHTASGAKDDRRDALVLADALRTDLEKFVRVEPGDECSVRVREQSRLLDQIKKEQRRASNRLWEQVQRYAPELLTLCPGADEPYFWALLELGADEEAARGLTESDVEDVLRACRIRKRKAGEVLALLQGPRLTRRAGLPEEIVMGMRLWIAQLQLLHGQAEVAKRRLHALLGTAGHDAKVILSQPGLGDELAGVLLGEASQELRARNLGRLRARCGQAPVTKASGKSRRVVMRRACNQRLQNACFLWAKCASRCDPYAKAIYDRLRAAGHTPARAWRGVGDRLLKRLIACLKSGTVYALPPAELEGSPAPSA